MTKKKVKKFSTHLLDEALRKKKEGLEKRRKELLAEVYVALEKLTGEVKFDKAYIFGSVTKEHRFKNNSDVDIGFLGLAGEDQIHTTALLSDWLEVDVDVVLIEGNRFADKIINGGIEWKKEKKAF